MRLQDRVALVTGAGTGLGKAIATRFAQEGARLVINDLRGDTAQQTAEEIQAAGGTAVHVQGDTSVEADVERAVAKAVGTYGRLDVLVNNAGIEIWKMIHEMTVEEWDRICGINLRGVFLCSKHGVRQMLTQGGGCIVNLSSVAGLAAIPLLGAYCTTKHGVVGLTRAMAIELRGSNIRVNAMCPGFVETAMVTRSFEVLEKQGIPIRELTDERQGRLGKAEEVANVALFLASDESSFITGTTIAIDNGVTAQ